MRVGKQYIKITITTKPAFAAGFTLIELLVVLLIIGIIITAATITIGNGIQNHRLRNTADELNLLIKFARDEAVLQKTVLGLALGENDYCFYQFSSTNANELPTWHPLKKDRILGIRKLDKNITLGLLMNNKLILHMGLNEKTTPPIILYSDGTMTEFTITIRDKESPVYRLHGSENGQLTMTDVGNDE